MQKMSFPKFRLDTIICNVFVMLVTGLFFASISFGQNIGGKLSGQITDPTGAIIPGAHVTAHNVNTGVVTSGQSDASGYYVIQLPIGTYSVTVSFSGFATSTQQDVVITTGGDVGLNFRLHVGGAQTVVTVNGGTTPLITPDSAAVQTTVTNALVATIPVQVSGSLRMASEFLQLEPGYNGTSLNGGAANQENATVDGVDVSPAGFNTGEETATAAMPVPAFAVQEFQVVGSNGEADTGRTSTGVIRYSLKSGTNHFHGDVFEFNRTTNYDAKTYFEKYAGPDHQNEFGGELGGPIQRNKTFFYGYYDGFRYSTANSATFYSVLTPAMRSGDFSASGLPPIYDPSTTTLNSSGAYTRRQFDCNGVLDTICQGEISSVSAFFASLMPDPNLPGIANNYEGASGRTIASNQYLIKIDHTFSPTNHASMSVNFFTGPNDTYCPFGNYVCGAANATDTTYSGNREILNWEKALSSTLFNHLVLGFNTLHFLSLGGGQQSYTSGSGFNGKAGFKGVDASGGTQINAGGYTILGGSDSNEIRHADAQLGDDFSWIHGKHEMQFGMEYEYFLTMGIQGAYGPTNWGQMTFSTLETELPGNPGTGFAPASFLLGDVDSGGLGQNPGQAMVQPYWAAYGQDAWKIRPNLTLTYGLRWEYTVPVYDRRDRLANFDPSLPNSGAGNILGALVFAGHAPSDTGTRQFATAWHRGFGPRLGIAYAFTPSTVFRAGYTLEFNDSNEQAVHMNQQGYFAQDVVSSLNGGITPAFNWDNAFPSVPLGPDLVSTFANGGSTSWEPPYANKEPQVENYNVGIQQQLWDGIVLDASYVGTQCHHMYTGALDPNQLSPKYLTLGNTLDAEIGSAAANAAGISAPYPGFIGTVAQALRPYPQYQTVTNLQGANGDETYNALQVRAQKTLSKGISMLVSYTKEKNISDVNTVNNNGAQNYYNWNRTEKAVTSYDTPQVFVGSYTYDLPLGKGKLKVDNKLADGIIGGWTASGV